MICQSWKVMFQAEYSSGQPMRVLADLRTVVEAAVAKIGGPAKIPAKPALKAKAAAASASASDAPEFEVSGGPHSDSTES